MNENCLQGVKCPKCGNESKFHISISALAEVTDEGVGELGDVEWDGNSICLCDTCGEQKYFFYFTEEYRNRIKET